MQTSQANRILMLLIRALALPAAVLGNHTNSHHFNLWYQFIGHTPNTTTGYSLYTKALFHSGGGGYVLSSVSS